MLTEHRKIFATIYHRAQAELRQSHPTFFIARCFNDKYRSMKDINPDKDSIKIKKGLTFDKDLFKSLSNDASRAKTHTNHIINNTKTNNQRVVYERTSSSTRLQSYDFITSLQIFSYQSFTIFLALIRNLLKHNYIKRIQKAKKITAKVKFSRKTFIFRLLQ